MARAHTLDACLHCESLIKHFTDSTTLPSPPLSSCLALWPASLTTEQACFYKAAVKRGESRYRRSWGLFRRSKILHRSVYSALWLGGLRCQCRRQTNGPLTARCPCVMVLGKKKICWPLQCVGPPGKMPGMPDYQSQPWLQLQACSLLWTNGFKQTKLLETPGIYVTREKAKVLNRKTQLWHFD